MTIPERITVIGPGGRGLRGQVNSLWTSRTLVGFLVWRDLKVRYRQTAIGATWAIAQPLVLMAVFWIFLGGIVDVPGGEVGYAAFAFVGLVPWTLFAQSVSQSANSIVNHQELVKKASFPKIVLPVSATGAFVADFVAATIVAIAFGVAEIGGLRLEFLVVPAIGFFAVIVALAIGVGLSALNVRFRDVRYATPFALQVWLFATPVVYPPSLAPPHLETLLFLNPMASVVALYRWSLLGLDFPAWHRIGISLVVVVSLLLISLVFFSRAEGSFADTV